jgi:hypothetical protein
MNSECLSAIFHENRIYSPDLHINKTYSLVVDRQKDRQTGVKL